ncbi:MAG: DnaJ C-terminal domain-containing protein [Collinsella sp.]
MSDISIAQAALGCEIEVEGIMPDEVVKVTVPAGAQYGDTVSVNNYGMPRIGGGGSRGRLIVQLRVVVPTNLPISNASCSVLLPMRWAMTSLLVRSR